MGGAAAAIRTAKPGNRRMDRGQLESTGNQIAFAAVRKHENLLHRTRGRQMIHVPVQAFIGAQMAP